MITLAIANSKGGVGKTTLAVHLAAGLALQGKRTLLVDLDPQANATAWLVGALPAGATGIGETLLSAEVDAASVLPVPGREGLSLLPSTPNLPGAELRLGGEPLGQMNLRRALQGVRSKFDAVILDCPPHVGVGVMSALIAADAVVAPVLGAFMSLAGLRKLEDMAARIREGVANARTHVLGYVLFAADPREAITTEARELLHKEAAGKLFKAEVRVSTAAKAMPAHRLLAWDAGADERGAEDYPAVLAEVLARLTKDGRTHKRK